MKKIFVIAASILSISNAAVVWASCAVVADCGKGGARVGVAWACWLGYDGGAISATLYCSMRSLYRGSPQNSSFTSWFHQFSCLTSKTNIPLSRNHKLNCQQVMHCICFICYICIEVCSLQAVAKLSIWMKCQNAWWCLSSWQSDLLMVVLLSASLGLFNSQCWWDLAAL